MDVKPYTGPSRMEEKSRASLRKKQLRQKHRFVAFSIILFVISIALSTLDNVVCYVGALLTIFISGVCVGRLHGITEALDSENTNND